ncbi:beta-4C adrenergic receptor-like [Acanthaster planci]|uniref:Beta-4C adrenergic receptor-like n=1 Tax=Acanthaster planci TaxID=133434 RepID=A0A8B7XMG2_ACAPL|nr:beta-4C adrenergic receptor-like [Acanthaster planci]
MKAIYTYPELVFCAVAISILITVTLVGNSLVLVAVARSKELQNATNVFVVNLSVTDCLASFAMLWSVPGLVSKTPGYPLRSNVPCVAAAGLVFIANGCSVLTLVNIALNRCILITRPKETYQWLYTPKKIAMMVLCSWLVTACGFILPPIRRAPKDSETRKAVSHAQFDHEYVGHILEICCCGNHHQAVTHDCQGCQDGEPDGTEDQLWVGA